MRHPERRNATQRLQTALNHLVPSPSSVHHLAASGSSGAGGWTPPMRPHGPDQDVDRAAALRIGMSEKETEFFKTNGFIVKRGLIPQKDLQPPRRANARLHGVGAKFTRCRNSTTHSTWSVSWGVILRYYSTWSVSWSVNSSAAFQRYTPRCHALNA
jgi:hypothetical protein